MQEAFLVIFVTKEPNDVCNDEVSAEETRLFDVGIELINRLLATFHLQLTLLSPLKDLSLQDLFLI